MKYFSIYIWILLLGINSCNFLDAGISLGNGYIFYSVEKDENDAAILKNTKTIGSRTYEIYPKVIEYVNNSDYIIVLRESTKEAEKSFKHAIDWNRYKKGYYQLWIIEKEKDSVYGPLNYIEYLGLRKKMSIPKSLDLEIKSPILDSLKKLN